MGDRVESEVFALGKIPSSGRRHGARVLHRVSAFRGENAKAVRMVPQPAFDFGGCKFGGKIPDGAPQRPDKAGFFVIDQTDRAVLMKMRAQFAKQVFSH